MRLFSGLAGMCFLPEGTPQEDAPHDAREITEERYQEIQVLLAQGYELTMDENAEPMVMPSPTVASVDLDRAARERRDSLLRNTDWIVLRAGEQGIEPPADVIAYRQALRDLPEQSGYPITIDWPDAPASV